ncbi:MAG: DsbE family thiol:disulfide interchange protein [Rhodospirillaceae bacterium]|nr:DsbE family thiol:disulfide interchange protein [Rhodospirillaceae bacterium]
MPGPGTSQAVPFVRRWPYLLPLVLILALGGVFTKRLVDVERGLDPSLIPTVLLNTPLPAFDLPPLPGRGQAMNSDELKGEVSLINVWGSWCIACLVEHPVLLEIAKSGDVPIHGIAWRDDPDRSLAWLAERGDPYAKIGQDPRSKAAIAFGVVLAPETFLIDKQGIIRYKQTGPITQEDWRTKIKPLIEQLKK